jgi:hypothetical protein
MTSPSWMTKPPSILLLLCLSILASPKAWARDDDPNALNQEVNRLIEQGKYQDAIPISERAVEAAKLRGTEQPETAAALNNSAALGTTGHS